jgi:hypothetical protein
MLQNFVSALKQTTESCNMLRFQNFSVEIKDPQHVASSRLSQLIFPLRSLPSAVRSLPADPRPASMALFFLSGACTGRAWARDIAKRSWGKAGVQTVLYNCGELCWRKQALNM